MTSSNDKLIAQLARLERRANTATQNATTPTAKRTANTLRHNARMLRGALKAMGLIN